MEGNMQQATSIDVERQQPRPIGGGTTGLGRDLHRRAWTEEELARYAAGRRRQYMFSLFVTILLPIVTLIFLSGPFLFTSWDRTTRIMWWLGGLCVLCVSLYWIRYYDRNYGYHPKIPSLPKTTTEAADEDYATITEAAGSMATWI